MKLNINRAYAWSGIVGVACGISAHSLSGLFWGFGIALSLIVLLATIAELD